MICICQTCKHCFWKYRKDWMYPGYCSSRCHDLRPPKSLGPETLESLQFLIRVHCQFAHGDLRFADRWWDCERCDELDAQLVAMRRLEVCFAPEQAGGAA